MLGVVLGSIKGGGRLQRGCHVRLESEDGRYMYAWICYTHLCSYAYIYIYTHTDTCICFYIYIYIYIPTLAHTYARILV